MQWVKDNDPDVLFLEEAWSYRSDPTVALTLARTLGYDLAYRLEMGFPDFFYEADAVLAKKSLHMSGEKDLKLPHSAWEIGNGKTWVIPFGGVSYAVGVVLTLADGEPDACLRDPFDRLYDFGSSRSGAGHPGGRASPRKEDGIDWEDAHVVIGGDFNSYPTDPAPTGMVKEGYEDSFATVHPGDSAAVIVRSRRIPG